MRDLNEAESRAEAEWQKLQRGLEALEAAPDTEARAELWRALESDLAGSVWAGMLR